MGFYSYCACGAGQQEPTLKELLYGATCRSCSKFEEFDDSTVVRRLLEIEIEKRAKDLVRIWSFEHNAWWRANRCGYTINVKEAGLYKREAAEDICRLSNLFKVEEEIREIE